MSLKKLVAKYFKAINYLQYSWIIYALNAKEEDYAIKNANGLV
jgi:hypothetical protein